MTSDNRGALLTPPAKPQRKRVTIHYKQASSVLQLHIKPSLLEQLRATSEYLGNPSGLDFSMSILARRALERYAEHVAGLSAEDTYAEATHLYNFYR